jgi:hypothetical protein
MHMNAVIINDIVSLAEKSNGRANTVGTSTLDVLALFLMNKVNLVTAFELLDGFLTAGVSAPVWLVVGGGSALLVQQLSSRQTKDMDVMALRESGGSIVGA